MTEFSAQTQGPDGDESNQVKDSDNEANIDTDVYGLTQLDQDHIRTKNMTSEENPANHTSNQESDSEVVNDPGIENDLSTLQTNDMSSSQMMLQASPSETNQLLSNQDLLNNIPLDIHNIMNTNDDNNQEAPIPLGGQAEMMASNSEMMMMNQDQQEDQLDMIAPENSSQVQMIQEIPFDGDNNDENIIENITEIQKENPNQKESGNEDSNGNENIIEGENESNDNKNEENNPTPQLGENEYLISDDAQTHNKNAESTLIASVETEVATSIDHENETEEKYPNDENEPIDMPNDSAQNQNLNNDVNAQTRALTTAPEAVDDDPTNIHVEFDESQDTVQLYAAGDEKPQKPTRTLASDVSLGELPPLTTSPELDLKLSTLLRNFERKGKIPEEIEMRPRLVQYLQREKVNYIVRQKYDVAQKYQNLTIKLLTMMAKKAQKDELHEKIEKVEEKSESAEQKMKNIQKETQELIEEEQEKQKERRYSLKVAHNDELKAFEAKWNDPEFLHIFEKPSSYLLQLKKMERSMVLTKMYDRAAVIRKKVAEIEKDESLLAQRSAYFEMEKQQKKILMRQQQELEIFEQHCVRNIELIKRNQEIKTQSVFSRKTKLQMEMGMIKEGQKNSLPAIGLMPPAPNGTIESVMTPRTAQRYSTFKAQKKGPQLTVKPLGNLFSRRRRRLVQSAPATDL